MLLEACIEADAGESEVSTLGGLRSRNERRESPELYKGTVIDGEAPLSPDSWEEFEFLRDSCSWRMWCCSFSRKFSRICFRSAGLRLLLRLSESPGVDKRLSESESWISSWVSRATERLLAMEPARLRFPELPAGDGFRRSEGEFLSTSADRVSRAILERRFGRLERSVAKADRTAGCRKGGLCSVDRPLAGIRNKSESSLPSTVAGVSSPKG